MRNSSASGSWRGVIGLLLVVVYSLFQYSGPWYGHRPVTRRGNGADLPDLVVLGTTHGFRADDGGVTGTIVAIGVTAGQLHRLLRTHPSTKWCEGRPLRCRGDRVEASSRTIIIADAVNMLARPSCSTCSRPPTSAASPSRFGLTTIIDLAVVVLFTHPMVQLLARTEFFDTATSGPD